MRLVFAFVATGCCVYLGQTGVTESTPQFQRRKTDTRQEGKKKGKRKKEIALAGWILCESKRKERKKRIIIDRGGDIIRPLA